MDPRYAKEEVSMLDYEGRVVERSTVAQDFFDVDMQNDKSYDISKVNIMKEDDRLVMKISALIVNYSAAQRPTENIHMGQWEQPEMKGISRTLGPSTFTSDIVERTAISNFNL